MENEQIIKIVYGLFILIIILSFLMSMYQLFFERKKVYIYSAIYWFMIFISSMVNVVVENKESNLYLISAIVTYLSQEILAKIIYFISDLADKYKPSLGFFGITIFFLLAMKYLNFPFQAYMFIALLGVVFPVFRAVIFFYSQKKRKKTSAQVLFVIMAVLLSFHYLDYPYFKTRPDLFAVASAIAFILMQIISSLMPMVANEFDLYRRNLNLEKEVKERIEELIKKDKLISEAEKYTSIGKIAGVLAHEFNTPLTSISTATNGIIKYTIKNNISETIVAVNSKIIKETVTKLSRLTELLKVASGDQLGKKEDSILFSEALPRIVQALKQNLKIEDIQFKVDESVGAIFLNVNEFDLLINTAVQTIADKHIDKIRIHVTYEENRSDAFYILNISGIINKDKGVMSDESFVNLENSELNIVLMKSIINAYGGLFHFNFSLSDCYIKFGFVVSK